MLLLDEFRSPLMLPLAAAAATLVVASQITDEAEQLIDTFLIWLIVLLNAGLGFSQSYRASREIESLNRLAAPSDRWTPKRWRQATWCCWKAVLFLPTGTS